MKHQHRTSVILILVVAILATTFSSQAKTERFEAADSQGVTATRDSTTLYLEVAIDVKGPITIPRLAAPLRSMQWQGSDQPAGLTLNPEQQTWRISWTARPAASTTLVLTFDDQPLLISEVQPIAASADGSFELHAHLALTTGEKVRYEPQPYKNTVGYWTGKQDSAKWKIYLDQPGRFNVAVLQGCGKGQGGSQAVMTFNFPVKDIQPEMIFEVLETGHFQNFQWVNLGEVELRHAGDVEVSVAPKSIQKAALMDIRAIHLIRLPDKK